MSPESVRFRHGKSERTIGPADGEIVVAPNTVHGLASVGEMGRGSSAVRRGPGSAAAGVPGGKRSGGAGRTFTPSGRPRGLQGVRWAASFLKRYRDETVFLSPPPLVQKVLIALFARP